MKQAGKMLRLFVTMLCMLALLAGTALAASTNSGVDWEGATIQAEGAGVAPATARSAAQARIMARRAALVDAYRQLAEQVKGVQIDATTTVEQAAVTNDTVNMKVSAFIQGARIVSEKQLNDGTYTVTLQAPLYGVTGSLASVVMPQTTARAEFPAPVATVEPAAPVQLPVTERPQVDESQLPTTTPIYGHASSASSAPDGRAIGGFTGLIVDCRGLGLTPVMSPTIENAAGEPIYGYKNLDYDLIVKNGMAGYAKTTAQAKRAGSNPLVVKAIRVDGGSPVLSTADANRVLIENGATGFLDTASVVFLR